MHEKDYNNRKLKQDKLIKNHNRNKDQNKEEESYD